MGQKKPLSILFASVTRSFKNIMSSYLYFLLLFRQRSFTVQELRTSAVVVEVVEKKNMAVLSSVGSCPTAPERTIQKNTCSVGQIQLPKEDGLLSIL